MNHQSSHMTDRQIDEYISADPGEDFRKQIDHIEDHMAVCNSCRKLVLERIQLTGAQQQRAQKPYPGCPGEETLLDYAAGLTAPETMPEVLHHAAHCNFCGPRLKDYMEDLSGEFDAEAQDFLGRLPAQSAWQKEFVRKHVILHRGLLGKLKSFFASFRFPKITGLKLVLVGGPAMILLAAIFVPGIVNMVKLKKADQLTINAFLESPKTELRYAWSPRAFDTKLGPGVPASSRHALHEAQYLADQEQDSSNPQWLRINGRLALLNRDINAVGFLKSAYDKGLRDPGTEIDLAAAYFMRDTANANRNGGPAGQNVSETVDLLCKVLKEPKLTADEHTAALYDLAVSYETMLHWDQAVSVWEQYLALDPTGPWAEEAERHLTVDRTKVPSPRPEGYKTPTFFEDHFSDPETQDSIEEYQDTALRTWLFQLMGNQETETARALRRLADVLEEQHGDSWMKDFLSRRRPGDLAGVQALSAAITRNKRGLYNEALDDAQAAEKSFEQTANFPGVLRSQFEMMYANQRLLAQQPCIKQGQFLEAALRGTSYRWLQVQTALTQASCLNRERNFQAADEMLGVGHQNAIRFRFHILELRALALDASLTEARDCNESLQKALAGLNLYWPHASSPMRLYEFYSVTKDCFEKKKLWHAAEAIERRIIAILTTEFDREDRNLVLETAAQYRLQVILTALNERLPKIAWGLFKPNPVISIYQLPIKLELAELQLAHGDAEGALATTEETKDSVMAAGDDLIRLNFYRIHGDILLKMRRLDAAESVYTTGLEIADQTFSGLKDGKKREQWMNETGEIYRGLVGVFLEQGRQEEALQLWEWYRSRQWLLDHDHPDVDRISWPEIESEVRRVSFPAPAGDARIIYAFIKDHVYIWKIGNARTYMPPPVEITREELQQRIGYFAQEIANEDSNLVSLEQDSQRLFSLLVAPVMADTKETDTVIVELDPMMNGLVVEALEGPLGQYFGQTNPVIYSPGLIKENDLRPLSHRAADSSWLLNALTANDQRVSLDLNGIKVVNAQDITARELSDRLAGSEMFIFLGHGKAQALLMPDGRSLQVEDFPPQSLQKLQLAALVACSSGTTQSGLLDTGNLVHAFLSAGVPAVIASHWDVSRSSTNRLVNGFLSHYEANETAARSMLRARQDVFRSGHKHPFYWAAFTLTGRAG